MLFMTRALRSRFFPWLRGVAAVTVFFSASESWAQTGAGNTEDVSKLEIPAQWLRALPGEREAMLIEQGAARRGWPAMSAALARAALETYARGNLETAGAWLNAARWAEAWAETSGAADKRWREAMAAAKWPGGYRSEPTPPDRPDVLMAELFSAELRVRMLADTRLAAQYFSLEQAVDRRTQAFAILARLHANDAKAFAENAAMAVAIALVHDVPPPLDWPHRQVSEQALPRALVAPEEVFAYFKSLDAAAKSLQRRENLDAGELRFLVDLALSETDRAWVQQSVRTPLAKLAETYSMIAYRTDRLADGRFVWEGASYTLPEILREGGICVDQAYFASQAGKARGVPTLIFRGAALDGRHAWFGYLGVGQRWNMEGGRDRSQNMITGLAHDPQTWMDISDHEIAFLSEGFRREKNARDSQLHAAFASRLSAAGRVREAEVAARTATRLERRNLEAWDTLLALVPEAGKARESMAREAASSLTAYPDEQTRYLGVVIASLRERGEGEEADRVSRELARRFADKRGDLTVREVAAQLERVQASEAVEVQMKVYRDLLRQFGRGAGAGIWDEAIRPFMGRLVEAGNIDQARQALLIARDALGVGKGSQLDREMDTLLAALDAYAKDAEKPR